MALYLGNVGQIQLVRTSLEGGKESVINPSDVNPNANRFSFDFQANLFTTGDFVQIASTDGTDLDFIDATGWGGSVVQSSGNWYVHVDQIGGVKLYNSFSNSLRGETTGLIPLNAITRDIPIVASLRGRDSRILADVTEYELNTNREVVDITALSDEHRQQYSSLISGSGSLVAHWDYLNSGTKERVHYLMQLVLRTEIGAGFHGKFYIKSEDTFPQSGGYATTQVDDAIWWEFDAIVTSSAVSFESPEIITGRIDFVATGPILLQAKVTPIDKLTQESGGELLLEQDVSSALGLED
jgi:hypothetical protein